MSDCNSGDGVMYLYFIIVLTGLTFILMKTDNEWL